MPHAICSSSEMKQGTPALARDARHRPEHRVGAAGHHAHRACLGDASSRASSAARHQALGADAAVLGGEVQRQAHGLHLGEQDQVGGAAAAVEHLGAARPSRCAAASRPACTGGETDPPGDQQIDGIGAAGPGSWTRADPEYRARPRAAPARAAPYLGRPSWRESRPFRRARPPSGKTRGEAAGSRPQAPRTITNCPGFAAASECAAGEPKDEITAPKARFSEIFAWK